MDGDDGGGAVAGGAEGEEGDRAEVRVAAQDITLARGKATTRAVARDWVRTTATALTVGAVEGSQAGSPATSTR